MSLKRRDKKFEALTNKKNGARKLQKINKYFALKITHSQL